MPPKLLACIRFLYKVVHQKSAVSESSTERGALFWLFCVSKVITTAHAHKKVVSFFILFQELSNNKKKKIKALRPKMTKIASRGSCLKARGWWPGTWSSAFFFFWQFVFPWVDLALLKPMKNFPWDKCVIQATKNKAKSCSILDAIRRCSRGPSADWLKVDGRENPVSTLETGRYATVCFAAPRSSSLEPGPSRARYFLRDMLLLTTTARERAWRLLKISSSLIGWFLGFPPILGVSPWRAPLHRRTLYIVEV